ncbi:MAG: Dabb family protein [Propionibacteriaceae bacterium]|nr:Dabb family protein [Propionibacteriaceae bacterium]
MIKHIVMWNFADEAEGSDKATNLAKAQQDLHALRGLVPGMGTFEVAIGADPLEHSYDMVLYSEFDSVESLQAYATHPQHVAVAQFIGKARTARACMDYEA